jgi:hypothetical protein
VRGVRLCVKLDCAEHIAMVCDGDALHPEVFASLEKLFETYGAVEERILAVQMKMSESFTVCHESILSACGGQVRKVSFL